MPHSYYFFICFFFFTLTSNTYGNDRIRLEIPPDRFIAIYLKKGENKCTAWIEENKAESVEIYITNHLTESGRLIKPEKSIIVDYKKQSSNPEKYIKQTYKIPSAMVIFLNYKTSSNHETMPGEKTKKPLTISVYISHTDKYKSEQRKPENSEDTTQKKIEKAIQSFQKLGNSISTLSDKLQEMKMQKK